jgi:hypothetical protein
LIMSAIKAKPADRAAVARNGKVAAVFRKLLKDRGLTPPTFNRAIGRPPGHTGIYQFLNAKASPGPQFAELISKTFGIPIEDLAPEGGYSSKQVGRKLKAASAASNNLLAPSARTAASSKTWVEPPANAPVEARQPVARYARSSPLSFIIDADGLNARFTLDLTLPVADAFSLLNIIKEAGALTARQQSS